MKAPKEMQIFCPKCRKHTEHTVALYKAGQRRAVREGERKHEDKKKGYGGQKFPFQRNKAKTTRKHSLRMTCRICGYSLQRAGLRLKKLEVV